MFFPPGGVKEHFSIQKLDGQERQESRRNWLLSCFYFWSFYDSTMVFICMFFCNFILIDF